MNSAFKLHNDGIIGTQKICKGISGGCIRCKEQHSVCQKLFFIRDGMYYRYSMPALYLLLHEKIDWRKAEGLSILNGTKPFHFRRERRVSQFEWISELYNQ